MSIALYDRSLTSGRNLTVHFGDGQAASLGLSRWHGAARGADASLLDAIDGPALDIGCGPGRIVAALVDRNVLASDGLRDPLHLAFPAALASRWMPGLFPERTE